MLYIARSNLSNLSSNRDFPQPSLPPNFQHAASLGPVLQLSERLIPHIAMQLVGQAGVVVLEAIVMPGTLLSVTILRLTRLERWNLAPWEIAQTSCGGTGAS